MNFADRIDGVAGGGADTQDSALARDGNLILSFTRVARAVRQIIVLEQELIGLRDPPIPHASNRYGGWGADASDADSDGGDADDLNDYNDLNDLDDLDDYARGPVDARIAGVMADLGVAPEDLPSHRRSAPQHPHPPASPARSPTAAKGCFRATQLVAQSATGGRVRVRGDANDGMIVKTRHSRSRDPP